MHVVVFIPFATVAHCHRKWHTTAPSTNTHSVDSVPGPFSFQFQCHLAVDMAANQLPSTLASCRLAFQHREKICLCRNTTGKFVYYDKQKICLNYLFSHSAPTPLLARSTLLIAIANSMQFLILFIWQTALACNACVWHMPHMSCPALKAAPAAGPPSAVGPCPGPGPGPAAVPSCMLLSFMKCLRLCRTTATSLPHDINVNDGWLVPGDAKSD